MEVEEGGCLPFLDTKAMRKENGNLDITVNHTQMHMDRYLHFRFHRPTLLKRGMVRCNYCARCIAQQRQNFGKRRTTSWELSWGMVILAPSSVLSLQPDLWGGQQGNGGGRPPIVHLLYVAGMRMCKDLKIKCECTLCSPLAKIKDPPPYTKMERGLLLMWTPLTLTLSLCWLILSKVDVSQSYITEYCKQTHKRVPSPSNTHEKVPFWLHQVHCITGTEPGGPPHEGTIVNENVISLVLCGMVILAPILAPLSVLLRFAARHLSTGNETA